MKTISEIQIIPVKPSNGLLAFCSFVLYEAIYCGSIAIFSRSDGTCRLVYPTRQIGSKGINIFYPVSALIGKFIEQEVTKSYKDVMNNDRYSINYNSTK